MSGSLTETETLVAAKRHRCTWCWQFIEKGETYKRYRFFGDAGTCKMHPECYDAMQDIATQMGSGHGTSGERRAEREGALPQQGAVMANLADVDVPKEPTVDELKCDVQSLIRTINRLRPQPGLGNPLVFDRALSDWTMCELTK